MSTVILSTSGCVTLRQSRIPEFLQKLNNHEFSIEEKETIGEILHYVNELEKRFHKFTREDIDNANLGSLMGDFGDLDTAGEQISNQGYTNCRLISVEVDTRFNSVSNTDSAVLVKTYETLTDSFVQITDDTVTFTENGLKQITRVYRAVSGTISSNVVGTTALNTGETLASSRIEDSEAFAELTETYIESGVLSRTTDLVGSQEAITIQAIGEVPATPAGYSLARTDVSDFEGIKTNRYTFLRPSILSVSQERTGGATTVQVRAFELTEAEVDTLLSEVTSSHILISQSESDYDGIVTSQFTYEIDDFEIESQAEDGMEIIVRTELRATDFSSGVIGTSTYKTLFLIEENIDNGNAIKKRTSRYSEAGVLSISPLEEDGFSLAPSYVYVTTGAPASSMTGLVTPDGTTLGTSVTWFEPKVQNVKGFPTYTQQVLTVSIIGNAVKIHSVNKFFTITEPGVMSTGGAFNTAQTSGAATRYPQATKQPRTYRKKATVDVYLTTSNLITESEVAFTEEGVDWCSIGFDSFYTNEIDSSASVSSSWRSFPQYLNSSGTTNASLASSTGVYFAQANSYGAGATTYTTTGIYRVELEKYTRAADGTQLYLKTIVTF
jgi:hypothetical protein